MQLFDREKRPFNEGASLRNTVNTYGAIGDPILGLMEPREAFERG